MYSAACVYTFNFKTDLTFEFMEGAIFVPLNITQYQPSRAFPELIRLTWAVRDQGRSAVGICYAVPSFLELGPLAVAPVRPFYAVSSVYFSTSSAQMAPNFLQG